MRTVMVLTQSLQIKTGFVAEVQTHTLLRLWGFTTLLQGIQGRGNTERDENVA